MPETEINLRRAPLPTHQRLPSDQFRYSGAIVALAAAAALVFAIMSRQPADDLQGVDVRVGELPQIN